MPTLIENSRLQRELGLIDLVIPRAIDQVITYEMTHALREGRPMRHMLALAGRGGTGKSALGFAIARELDVPRVILVTTKPDKNDISWTLERIENDTFLLLDEVHEYGKQAWLLDLLEGARGLGRDVNFTAFAATTNRGQLPQTLFSRFPIRLDIDYTDDELVRIAKNLARRFDIVLDENDIKTLMNAAVGNPRTMRNILGFWGAGPEEAVRMAQLTWDGLDRSMMEMLYQLREHGRPMGRETLSRVLEAPGGIQDIEAVLVRRRYVKPAPNGLAITRNGINRVIHNEREEGGGF